MAAAVQFSARNGNDDIFASVFPPKHQTAPTPTPTATPNIGTLASSGTAFGGFGVRSNAADEAAKVEHVWNSVIHNLTIALSGTTSTEGFDASTFRDVVYLLQSASTRKRLMGWYSHEISTHFRVTVQPQLSFWQYPIPVHEAEHVLYSTSKILAQAQNRYLSPFNASVHAGASDADVMSFARELKRNLHALVLHCLPQQRVLKTLSAYLFETMKQSLAVSSKSAMCNRAERCSCELSLNFAALQELQDIGLGGTAGQRACAHAVYRLLKGPALERQCFEVDWVHGMPVVPKLRNWIREHFMPAVQRAVAVLSGDTSMSLSEAQFTSAAISTFGRLRVMALFNYVSMWPSSRSGVLDIREYLTSTGSGEKAQLCTSFSEQVHQRLLHAGASTTDILSMYVSVITVFKMLDSRGVLLEKVAIPIRNYLRSRDDTVTVIAASFLAEIDANGEVRGREAEKVCIALTNAIANSTVDTEDHRLLNWDDMDWVPDPIDAGPDYRATKSDDIVAYVLNLFESDDFIKTFSGIFGDHLLRTSDVDLIKEIRLIELLKSRLDSSKLQQAEVMLKDMRDSLHLNTRVNPHHGPKHLAKPTPKDVQAALPEDGISEQSLWRIFKDRMNPAELRAQLALVGKTRDTPSGKLWVAKRTRLPPEPARSTVDFYAKVISTYFWPTAQDMEYRIPTPIKPLMKQYEEAFSRASGQRTLMWLKSLGTTNVELELKDGRRIKENGVELWKASIIYVFAAEERDENNASAAAYDEDEGMSLDELVDELNLEEEFISIGLSFWVSKQALFEKTPGRWAVLEHLSMMADAAQDLLDEVVAVAAPALSPEMIRLKEKAATYQNFIEGMLRNQGAKQIDGFMGITSMLKMVMPDFTYGDDEVKWLLEDMAAQGKVTQSGQAWSIH